MLTQQTQQKHLHSLIAPTHGMHLEPPVHHLLLRFVSSATDSFLRAPHCHLLTSPQLPHPSYSLVMLFLSPCAPANPSALDSADSSNVEKSQKRTTHLAQLAACGFQASLLAIQEGRGLSCARYAPLPALTTYGGMLCITSQVPLSSLCSCPFQHMLWVMPSTVATDAPSLLWRQFFQGAVGDCRRQVPGVKQMSKVSCPVPVTPS
jgi:hypothetical protein